VHTLRATALDLEGGKGSDECMVSIVINSPTIVTSEVTLITSYSAVSGGNITNDGGIRVNLRGVCWSTSPNPTIQDNYIECGSGIGEYICKLTGLTDSTTYYIRSYATNDQGTFYGHEITFITSSKSTSFNYPDFSMTEGLSLLGNAEFTNDILRITRSYIDQVGACWYTENQILVKEGFETEFQFKISDYSGWVSSGGDGLVFLIMDASYPINVTGWGGNLGYEGLKGVVAVEFDIVNNEEYPADQNHNNIAIHSNGPDANSPHHDFMLARYIPDEPFKDGNPHNVIISYKDQTLHIYLDSYSGDPVISLDIDIDSLLELQGGPVWIGFSASTGLGVATHDILSWTFNGEFTH
jgi:hypothetical protein